MAILGECEVQIIVDGTPAKEYDDNEEDTRAEDQVLQEVFEEMGDVVPQENRNVKGPEYIIELEDDH